MLLALLGVLASFTHLLADLGKSKMAFTNARANKGGTKNSEHHLSEEESSSDVETSGKGLTLTDNQMESVSLLVRSAVSAAVVQVLPLAP